MLELGVGADIFRSIGWIYLGLTLICVMLAIWLPKQLWLKSMAAIATLIGFGYAPVTSYFETVAKSEITKIKYDTAMMLFKERCSNAGEKIYKTVDDVQGVLLLKLRAKEINFADQFKLDDPFGAEGGAYGDDYIRLLLLSTEDLGYERLEKPRYKGFRYVDTIDPENASKRYRYSVRRTDLKSGLPEDKFPLDRQVLTSEPSRYGITYEDISTPQDRENWIAGSALRIIDLQSKETIAERIGYMVDQGLGNTAGGRSPWAFAYNTACPAFPQASGGGAMRVGNTRRFIFSVFKSKSGD